MKRLFYIFIAIGLLINYACATHWTQAIQSGTISQNQFRESVGIEIRNGLIFLPVTIQGKEYRFLFDSGAPLSISEKLQDDFNFKIVSTGNLIDSDHNRSKIEWAKIESINIGKVSFNNQTAFIGDFEANPFLKCLKIDGIIGSNLLRYCNWTIDQERKSLTFSDTVDKDVLKGSVRIPFRTDDQYNMFTDLSIGQATVRNVLVDYGSNGSIALNDQIFNTIKARNIIGETLIEKGAKQSGIVGKAVALSREIVYTDSVKIDSISLKKVMLRTGKTVSVGNNLLSRFRVTIDWKNKALHLLETKAVQDSISFPGFRLGYDPDKGVYVQAVIENSNAYRKGVRANMSVEKLDGLDFKDGNDFCDYANHKLGKTIFIALIDSTGSPREYHFEQTLY